MVSFNEIFVKRLDTSNDAKKNYCNLLPLQVLDESKRVLSIDGIFGCNKSQRYLTRL